MTAGFCIENEEIQISPGTRILRVDELEKYHTANQVIADARKTAEDILNKAKQVYVEEKARGYEEGLAMANDEKVAVTLQTSSQYASAIDDLENNLSEIMPKILRKLLGDIDRKELMDQYIKQSIDEQVHEEKLTIKINPRQLDYIEAFVKEKLSDHPLIRLIRIQKDATLDENQTVLETKSAIIILNIEQQIEKIRHFAEAQFNVQHQETETRAEKETREEPEEQI